MFANFDYQSIDREAYLRTDISRLNQFLQGPDSRIVLWHENKLLKPDDDIFFRYTDVGTLVDSLSTVVYLGRHQQLRFFTGYLDPLPSALQNSTQVSLRTISHSVTGFRLGLLFHAQGLLNWHRNHAFCSCCGHGLKITQAGHAKSCVNPVCGKTHYPKLDPAVIFSVELKQGDEPKILLGRQPHWEPKRYSVIAGFVEPGESLEDAVRREAYEETGLSIGQVDYVASQPWPFPDSLMVGFHGQTKQTQIQLLDNELEQAQWFSADQLERAVDTQQLKMPTSVSISWYLIDRWFRQVKGYSLATVNFSGR